MAATWLAAVLPASAEPNGFPDAAPKTLGFEFARLQDPDNNARVWWSFNQAFGLASRTLGESGADGNWGGRLGEFLGLAYLNLAIGHYSHELGHNVHLRGWTMDASQWGAPWPWPAFNHGNRCETGYCDDPTDWIQESETGLNQEEFDAYYAYSHSLSGMSFDESMAFSFRKFSIITYDVYTGRVFGRRDPNGDTYDYENMLRSYEHVRMSSGAFILQAAVSDLLTARLWEAWIGNWNYLHDGIRETPNLAWHVGDWTVLPPLVTEYLTPRGGFYDIAVFSRPPGAGVCETRLGWDADFLGTGKVNRARVGGAYSREFPLGKSVQAAVMPSAYTTLRRGGLVPIGWVAGLEARSRFFDRYGLICRLEDGHGDIVEHVAKWKAGGFRTSLGAELRL
ncbi:MAG: hypothetical protein JF616_22025 [Fibrobacteres bacterium]|nr:hypothetical protein [Fibrobacterota bacterium]